METVDQHLSLTFELNAVLPDVIFRQLSRQLAAKEAIDQVQAAAGTEDRQAFVESALQQLGFRAVAQ